MLVNRIVVYTLFVVALLSGGAIGLRGLLGPLTRPVRVISTINAESYLGLALAAISDGTVMRTRYSATAPSMFPRLAN